ncbi:hypothetical protein K491DRAFT_311657 [Lophiostoma macrostomum CBS 122681]|uniref:NADH-ubiquinone oxidoreductase 213 kDa subunit n=1 Tax=Lophiostoma macrostomum CBS 122681 TaxID=1314788 RepID=A0A6A6TFP8_9PLEO|nr:hypothetical protein K491DRAFT_311657 [Lophiostoma macrostomum CBS 122681]
MADELGVERPLPESFTPVDTLANTASSTAQLTLIGALFAGAQNALQKQNVGAMGIFTRSGHIIATFAVVGATYQFTRDATANLRQKQDTYNEAIGGFAAGAMLGVTRRSIPFMFGGGVITATVLSTFVYTKGWKGYKEETFEDEVEKKEAYKKTYRRPLQETIDELGEGRGIYGPGYAERRRQRLLDRYGIDVGPYQGNR